VALHSDETGRDFLVITWDGGGNTPPMRAIAAALLARGHGVRVVGPECRRSSYEPLGARFEAYVHAPEHDAGNPQTDIVRDWQARTPMGAFARMRDNLMFGPAAAFAREVEAAVERERPAGAVIDYMLTGAAAGARRAGIPAMGLVHSVYPLPVAGVPPFGLGLTPPRGPAGRIRDRVLARVALRPFAVGLHTLNSVRRASGLPEIERLEGLLDDFASVVVVVPPEFDLAGRAARPPAASFVGHLEPPASELGWESPWSADDPRPLVVVSLSTTFMDQRALATRILQALGRMAVRALVTTGPALDLEGVPIPHNVALAAFVPHAAVMPEASVVVTHAGLGTVAAALRAGVPVVCLPSGRDQPDNAVRVVEAGAGIRLSKRASATRIRSAIQRALTEPALQAGAHRMQAAFARDGTPAVVAILETMTGDAPRVGSAPGA
jgi:UDP:flavonoid glycosyltransferase YjiC (YdhE family)